MRKLWRILKWVGLGLLACVLALAALIAYVEFACRGETGASVAAPIIKAKEYQRAEANTFLTYPEWHIVYAYEGLAEVLKTGDEHDFDYLGSIASFWSSACTVTRTADAHGGADASTKRTIYVIGASFTLEMAMKAIYEETLGRMFTSTRNTKTAQDIVSADVASEYAAFLQQTPWYKFDFDAAVSRLWSAPADSLRGWERRFALSGEWKAKAAYAGVIDSAVQATGVAQLEILSVVTGLGKDSLTQIQGVEIFQEQGDRVIIKTPRYQAFNAILEEIAKRGGQVVEIAGNDDILVTVTHPASADLSMFQQTHVMTQLARDGFGDVRSLLNVKVVALSDFLRTAQSRGIRVEHVYDY
jgi:hypothetical protein